MQSEFNCYEEGGLSTNNGEQLKMVGKKEEESRNIFGSRSLEEGKGSTRGRSIA